MKLGSMMGIKEMKFGAFENISSHVLAALPGNASMIHFLRTKWSFPGKRGAGGDWGDEKRLFPLLMTRCVLRFSHFHDTNAS